MHARAATHVEADVLEQFRQVIDQPACEVVEFAITLLGLAHPSPVAANGAAVVLTLVLTNRPGRARMGADEHPMAGSILQLRPDEAVLAGWVWMAVCDLENR